MLIKKIITIEAIVYDALPESMVSGNEDEIYDEQTLEDWHDFASNVEGLIERNGIIKKISFSRHPNSLSQYIDFYIKDNADNIKRGLIDLRLSDHKSTTNSRRIRKKNASKIDPEFKLVSVIVNKRTFDTYDEALCYVKTLLANLSSEEGKYDR